MGKTLVLLGLCCSLLGCVKLEIKPGDVVADTVDAGKDLYRTIQRKRSGEEERRYTHTVESLAVGGDTVNIRRCMTQIQENIATTGQISSVVSESSEVLNTEGVRKIQCEMVVLVIPD